MNNFCLLFNIEPSTPGKFIVWFRNETTLLVLWQPSYPASVFTHYKVCIFLSYIVLRIVFVCSLQGMHFSVIHCFRNII